LRESRQLIRKAVLIRDEVSPIIIGHHATL
jgi:hypothetical protein